MFHFPHYAKGPAQTPQSAILANNLKLIRFHETKETQLFDLAKDIGEKNDLTKEMPDQASALADALDAYLTRIDAQLPSPNPNYDPDSLVTGRRRQEARNKRGVSAPRRRQ